MLVEGDLHTILQIVEECNAALHREGVVKVESTLSITSRSDHALTMQSRMATVTP